MTVSEKMNTKTGNLLTTEFRVAGPFNVWRPKTNDDGTEKFSLRALFRKGASLLLLKKIVEDAAEEKFGKNWKSKSPRLPFRNQGEKDDYQGYQDGAIFVNLSSWEKPNIVDADGTEIIGKEEFYPGCWARASVRAYAYDKAGNRGVGLRMVNLQKLRDDEPLAGGSTSPEDDFEMVGEPATEAEGSSLDDLLG